jgi:putative transposase
MGGEDDVAEDEEARQRREEGCRREEAIRGLLKRHDDQRLTIGAVEEIAQELGVSRSTMYRLITAYRAKGTVSSVEPRALGRRKDTLVLDAKREKLIASTIREIYLKPERPTMTYLIEQVRARCAQKGLPLPDRRTIKARVDRIDRRTVALKRKDAKGVKATKTVPGQYVTSRPLEVVQIDHTEVDVFLVDETTRKTMDKRPWLTLAIDVLTRMVVGFHLSMDKPSRVSLGLCMLNAVYDKSAWLAERKIDASWPAAGLPEAVHADNGPDFRSHAFAWACREEGIKLIFRPIGTPHYGGHIERLIGTVSRSLYGANMKPRWHCACPKTAWRFGSPSYPTPIEHSGPTGSGSMTSPIGRTRFQAKSAERKASFSLNSIQETSLEYSFSIPTAVS